MSRPTATLAVTAADVEAAAARIAGSVERTPTAHSVTLSAITGADVYVKFENFQFTASFKDRGARNKLLSLSPEERARGVVAMSAGNHAQAVAHHATLLGIPATIVMPVWTPQVKVHRTAMLGARVVLEGDDLKEAAAVARGLERDQGMVFVSPYDDAAIIAGGTCDRVARRRATGRPLVVPVGGGGLISGWRSWRTHAGPTSRSSVSRPNGSRRWRMPCASTPRSGRRRGRRRRAVAGSLLRRSSRPWSTTSSR
jgi:threonine dehydratase